MKNIGIDSYSKKDFVIVLLIILLPFAFYLYNIAPFDTKVWKTKYFEIDSGFYNNVNFYLWYLSVKLLTISLLSIWYVTCKHWWKYILIIPLITEVYKILVVYSTSIYGFNYLPSFFESSLIFVPLIFLLEFFTKILGFKRGLNRYPVRVNEEINNRLIELSHFNSKNYLSVKKRLLELEKQKYHLDKKVYLTKLIQLRDCLVI